MYSVLSKFFSPGVSKSGAVKVILDKIVEELFYNEVGK